MCLWLNNNRNIKSKAIIVDATHTKSGYNQKTPRQMLQEQSKKLRRSVYEVDENMKGSLPAKNTEDSLEKEPEYCSRLMDDIKQHRETLICDAHSEQAQFQETEHFKEKTKEQYKIEAKNSELKHRHGYDIVSSSGLIGMEMEGAMAIFAVNLKRIIKLINEK